MVWNALAISIAAAALLMSSVLAMQQAGLMLRANHIPVYMEVFSQERSVEFQDNYLFVITRLAQENVAEQTGISALPDEARAAVYDVVGLYAQVGTLRLLGVVDRRIDSMMQVRCLRAWKALAPFVYEERRRQGLSNMLWRTFEEFAADIERLPEGSINDLIDQHRRLDQHRRWRAVWAAVRRNALDKPSGDPAADSGTARSSPSDRQRSRHPNTLGHDTVEFGRPQHPTTGHHRETGREQGDIDDRFSSENSSTPGSAWNAPGCCQEPAGSRSPAGSAWSAPARSARTSSGPR